MNQDIQGNSRLPGTNRHGDDDLINSIYVDH